MEQIAIIGAGVIGLTTGIKLLEEGHTVSIYANTLTPNTASSGAGAIWMYFKTSPKELVKQWLQYSFKCCAILSQNQETGIELIKYREFYQHGLEKTCWPDEINHPYQLLASPVMPFPYQSGFEAETFRLDTTVFLPYMQKKFMDLGGKLFHQYVTNLENLPAPIIINCMGAYASEIVSDSKTFPIRGQYILLDKIPDLNIVQFCFLDDENYIGIVPRKNDCWVGGTANPHTWEANINHETTQFILAEAAKLVPDIKKTKVSDVRVSFRSGREGVRLEKEPLKNGRMLIHNYGHGGSGFSLSFGCAAAVAKIVAEL